MRRAVEAGGAEDDLARLLLGVVDEVLEGLPRRVGADHQHGRIGIDARDARELIARVVRRAPEELVDLGQDGDADERHEHGIPVGLAARRGLVTHRARRAGLVDHDHRLLQQALEHRGYRARGIVGEAARRERHDHRHGARRIRILRLRHGSHHPHLLCCEEWGRLAPPTDQVKRAGRLLSGGCALLVAPWGGRCLGGPAARRQRSPTGGHRARHGRRVDSGRPTDRRIHQDRRDRSTPWC